MKEEKTASRFKALFADRRHSAGANISWGAVIAGFLTFIALLIMSLFLGASMGFGSLDFQAANPFENLGVGAIIWAVVSLLLSFYLAGLVAGSTAGRCGFVHGFLTWAASLILAMVLMVNGTIGIFNTLGNVLGFVGRSAGSATSAVGKAIGDASKKSFEKLTKEVKIDSSEISSETKKILKDTEVKELQPEYLKGQLNEVVENLKESGEALLKNPTPETLNEQFKAIVEDVKGRVEKISKAPDKEAISKAVAKNTSLSEAEAKESTEKVIKQYKETAEKVKEGFNQLEKKIEQVKVDLQNTIEKAKKAANEAAQTAAKVSLYAFIAMLICLFVTGFGGTTGSAIVRRRQRDLV